MQLNENIDFRGWIIQKKADDAGGLTPAKEDNAFLGDSNRKDRLILIAYWYQQPKPQIWLRICQMEPQPVLQLVLQEKKNILPTSLSEFVSRGHVAL